MADWRDGAEYAPFERPFGFASPRAEPLAAPAPVASPADGQPAVAPQQFAAPEAAPLATLAPRTRSHRDPREAFDTANSFAPAGQTAWGAVAHGSGGWTPTQPLGVAPDAQASDLWADGPAFPAPQGAPVAAAATGPQAQPWGPPASASPWAPQGQAPSGAPMPGVPGAWGSPAAQPSSQHALRDAGILICLVAGLVVHPLAFLLIVAAFALAWTRRPRVRGIVNTLGGGLIAAFLLGAMTSLGSEPGTRMSGFNSISVIECFVLLVVVGAMMLVNRRR